jgi:hypothetical protein
MIFLKKFKGLWARTGVMIWFNFKIIKYIQEINGMQTQANALDSKLDDFWKKSLGMIFCEMDWRYYAWLIQIISRSFHCTLLPTTLNYDLLIL